MLTSAAFVTVLVICSVSDIRSREIGIEMPPILAAIALVHSAFGGMLRQSIISSLCTFIVLILLCIISRQAIGLGDVAVLSACAAFTGVYSVVLVFSLAILLATIVTVLGMVISRTKERTQAVVAIPFIPYITAGFILILFQGGGVCGG